MWKTRIEGGGGAGKVTMDMQTIQHAQHQYISTVHA